MQAQCKGMSPWKKHQNGRERPHFFAAKPPKSFVGRSRPRRSMRRPFFHGGESEEAKSPARFIKLRVQKRRGPMAILKSPPKLPKNETLQIRVEDTIRSKLSKYAEFIGSSESYVVSESLRPLFRKDNHFKTWLEEQHRNGDQHQNGGDSLFETVKKA